MENMLEQIMSDTNQEKKVISLAKKIAKKFSLKSGKDLENLTHLCYWLYIYGQAEKSISLCKIVDQVPFVNNFDIWTWIEAITALQIRIFREQNDNDKIEEYRQRLIIGYEGEEETLRVIVNGSLLYDENIKSDTDEGDEKGANAWRFLQIVQLCIMRELGGSEIYPIEALDKEIDRLKNILSMTW